MSATKEERKRQREQHLQWWKSLEKTQQEEFITANKEKYQEAFKADQAKLNGRAKRIEDGISDLLNSNAKIFKAQCPVYRVIKPARRDQDTGIIIYPATMEPEPGLSFGISLGVRAIKHNGGNNLQCLHVAFAIRSPKDSENGKVSRMLLGERMGRDDEHSFEFNSPIGIADTDDKNGIARLESACWTEFTAYVCRPEVAMPSRFTRSWLYDTYQNYYPRW